jgi:hypothetical protein
MRATDLPMQPTEVQSRLAAAVVVLVTLLL